ncbi:hypothetical protein [Breoghania sp. L-A4]|uniref:hypothetical protein n=1 Tax=Breoghania sp. L-A4 TaxID=2304600 RepID=UPI000E35801C|nr:hypothetical protein [Breoghania sp. L-A4]AXS41153.1 hypothetical protein D1F64_15395 [Breoghania sp. L-A4]
MLLTSKVLNFAAALLLAIPALHALLRSQGADRFVSGEHRDALSKIGKGIAGRMRALDSVRFGRWYVLASVLGIAAAVTGFFLDLACTAQWFGACS